MPRSASSNFPFTRWSAPGERALLVAEELAVEQGVGERGRVERRRRERPPGARSCGWRAASSVLPVPDSPRMQDRAARCARPGAPGRGSAPWAGRWPRRRRGEGPAPRSRLRCECRRSPPLRRVRDALLELPQRLERVADEPAPADDDLRAAPHAGQQRPRLSAGRGSRCRRRRRSARKNVRPGPLHRRRPDPAQACRTRTP